MNGRSVVRPLAIVAFAVAVAGAGCGKGGEEEAAVASRTEPMVTRLSHDGVAIEVPRGWDGRVVLLDPAGGGFVVQVANFVLPEGDVNVPPQFVASGEDPIKGMEGDEVLVILELGESGEAPAGPVAIRAGDFVAPGHPRVPRGHALAERLVCAEGGCFRLSVDFASAPADPHLIDQVNEVLASLTVESTGGREEIP